MSLLENLSMQNNQEFFDISEDIDELLIHSNLDFHQFKDKTVLITGGTGFFGIWILVALIKIKKHLKGSLKIIVLSRDPDAFISLHPHYKFSSYIDFISDDVRLVKLDTLKVNYLVHMATTRAEETFRGEDQLNKIEMLYEGTRNVLEQCGPYVEKVLFTSSGVAYGKNLNQLISENDFSGPDTTKIGSSLSLGKLVGEYLISYYSEKYGYKFSIARCFSFAGQYLPLNLHYAFGNFVKQALAGEDILISGDGQDQRSYLYIGDAIAWLLRLLVEPKNEIYNVGSNQPIKIKDLATFIAREAKSGVGIIIEKKTTKEDNFKRQVYIPSIQKIKNDYPGIDVWTDLRGIVKKMMK